MKLDQWGRALVESVRHVSGDEAAESMERHLAKPGPQRLMPEVDDSSFEHGVEPTQAEYDEASDRAEARDTAQREWRAR